MSSRRLPGKPLADIGGQTMIERVWRAVSASGVVSRVLIATEDDEICAAVSAFGGEFVRTGPAANGTLRVAEVIGARDVLVLNVQADMPFIEPSTLAAVMGLLERGAAVATASALLLGDEEDRSKVKITTDRFGRATAFSRSSLGGSGPTRVHVGIYGFGVGWLPRCLDAGKKYPEEAENLEQLAWLTAGIEILVVDVPVAPLSVDTPADLADARRWAALRER